MAKVTIIIDTRTADKQGCYPVKIRIVNNNTNTSISTGVFVKREQFIGEPEHAISRTFANAKQANADIKALYYSYCNLINELSVSGDLVNMSAADIRDYKNGGKQKKDLQSTFTYIINRIIDDCKNEGTKKIYQRASKAIHDFFGKQVILFSDIKYKSLVAFDSWLLEHGNTTNSRSIIVRCVRRVFNVAIDEEIISQSVYPFRKFKIKETAKEKEYLTESDFIRLLSLDLQGADDMARDVFVLSFLFCGANIVDIFNMQQPGINNVCSFVRTKIASKEPLPIHIKLQPETLSIIEKYKGKHYLLSFAEHYTNYSVFKSFISKHIRKIGNELGINLFFYLARYSWATYASKLDIPDFVISKALGHTDATMAQKHYISFDWSKVDNANRQVIDYIMNYEKRIK